MTPLVRRTPPSILRRAPAVRCNFPFCLLIERRHSPAIKNCRSVCSASIHEFCSCQTYRRCGGLSAFFFARQVSRLPCQETRLVSFIGGSNPSGVGVPPALLLEGVRGPAGRPITSLPLLIRPGGSALRRVVRKPPHTSSSRRLGRGQPAAVNCFTSVVFFFLVLPSLPSLFFFFSVQSHCHQL